MNTDDLSFFASLKDSRMKPVGFFDSGIGGLCIRNAFRRFRPAESTLYIADRAHCPYGNRSFSEIRALSRQHASWLLNHGAKAIVVACNTATAAAIDLLRGDFPAIPVIGIEPAVKPAALHSRTHTVGVLATAGTFNGRLYRETSSRFAHEVTILTTVADDFVELVESGNLDGAEAEAIVHRRIDPLLAAGADHLVLGCTHFPHLRPLIERLVGNRAVVIDPSDAVARQIDRRLAEVDLTAPADTIPRHVYLETRGNGELVPCDEPNLRRPRRT